MPTMQNRSIRVFLLVIIGTSLLLSSGFAQSKKHHKRPVKADVTEKKISKKDIPAEVLKSFDDHFPTAVIKGQTKQTREKVAFYEIESVDSGKSRDVLFQSDGVIVEIAISVGEDQLPESIRKALNEKYPDATVTSAASVTRGDHIEYEMTLQTGKKTTEVVANLAGKIFTIK